MTTRLFGTTLLLLAAGTALAQGYGTPLTVQGLDRQPLLAAASRGLGGTTIGVTGDPALMFAHPAALASLKGVRLTMGGEQHYTTVRQIQQFGPLKYYSNFSLLMEGLTVRIPNPDTLLPGVNAGDTVQRPYDTIEPGWSRSRNRGLPLQIHLAVPFTLGERSFVAGAGIVRYADLDHFYQHNNVLSPSILSLRPLPVHLPPSDSVPVIAEWSQFLQRREGSVRGYGAALAGSVTDEIIVGLSGLVLDGTSDDFEQRVTRGRLTFYRNFFRLDSVYARTTAEGTSSYSGAEFTLSAMYRGPVLAVGAAIRPPATITRTYSGEIRTDTTGTPAVTSVSGSDNIRLPWRGTLGISVTPHASLMLGVEYEIRPYESAEYAGADGTSTRPWLSAGLLRVGVQYTVAPWLALRAGIRGASEVFEPEGNPLPGDPVTSSVYAGGVGLSFEGVRANITYEYAAVKVQDVWNGAVSQTTDRRHAVVAELSYELPWMP